MEEGKKIELYEKAIFIVKNAGKKDGIYFHLDKKGLYISYSEYEDLLTVYYNLPFNPDPVLSAKKGKIIHITDDPNSLSWIDMINREFRILMHKNNVEK